MSETTEKTTAAPRIPSRRETGGDGERSRRLGVPTTARPGQPTRWQRIIEGIKTFLWVAPLTVLIWFWAERTQRAEADVSVSISAIRSASADRIVTLVSPEEGKIDLTISGPRASLDNVRDNILSKSIELNIPDLAPGQDITLNTVDLLAKSEKLIRAGVTVDRARPATVKVHVQERETKQVPVQMRPDSRILAKPKFEPEMVQVSGPSQELKLVDAVYVNVSSYAGIPGTHTAELPVALQNGTPLTVSINPQRVKTTVSIQQSDSVRQDSIPLSIAFPAVTFGRQLGDWQVSPQQTTIAGVKLVGPADMIEQIRKSPTTMVKAFVELGPQDLIEQEKVIVLKPENYRVPPNVTVENPEQTIRIRITPR